MTSRRRRSVAVVVLVVMAAALALAAVASIVIARGMPLKPYRLPSESMLPTFQVNERVLVERVSVRLSGPSRGDVVIFNAPEAAATLGCGAPLRDGQACARPHDERSDTAFIKRVVAGPGDRLKVVGGQVHIDGEPLDEDYARLDDDCASCNLEKEITIPADHWFMMGDNRGESADSREWGPVPEDWIIGKVLATYWPPNRIGGY